MYKKYLAPLLLLGFFVVGIGSVSAAKNPGFINDGATISHPSGFCTKKNFPTGSLYSNVNHAKLNTMQYALPDTAWIFYENEFNGGTGQLATSNFGIATATEFNFQLTAGRHRAHLCTKLGEEIRFPITVPSEFAGDGVDRQILYIGDSLTDNTLTLNNLKNYFNSDVMDITLVGSQDQGTAPNEGYSGKTYKWFYTHENSPFTYNGQFDFGQYLADQNITLGADDWIIIQLGTNDIFHNSQAQMQVNIFDNATAMIADIEQVTDARIAVATIHPFNSDYNVWVDTYSNGDFYWNRTNANWPLFNQWVLDTFSNSDQHILPLHYVLDRQTDIYDAVHPYGPSYQKIAKTVHAFIKAHE